MKVLAVAMAVAMLASGAAFAGGGSSSIDIAYLAERSGLSERQVRMVLGAKVPFVEYRTTYPRARAKLRNVVGSAELDELVNRYRDEVQPSLEAKS